METPNPGASGPNPAPKAGGSSLPVNPGDTAVVPPSGVLPDVSGDVTAKNPANKTSKLETQTDEGKDDGALENNKDLEGSNEDDKSGDEHEHQADDSTGDGSGGDKPLAPPSGGDGSPAQKELLDILTSTLTHVASFTEGGKHAEELDNMTRELTQAVNFLTMGPITDDGLEKIKALLVQIVGPIEGLATRLKELKARDTLAKANSVMDKYRKFRGL